MTINLTPAQMAWLKAYAAEHGIATLDEAAQTLIAQAMLAAQHEAGYPDLDDLDWVKPLLEEARAEFDKGRGSGLDEFETRMDAHVSKLRNS